MKMNICPLSGATMGKFTEFDELHSTKDLSCCLDLTSERLYKFLRPYLVGETRFDTLWLVFMFTISHRQNHIKHTAWVFNHVIILMTCGDQIQWDGHVQFHVSKQLCKIDLCLYQLFLIPYHKAFLFFFLFYNIYFH